MLNLYLIQCKSYLSEVNVIFLSANVWRRNYKARKQTTISTFYTCSSSIHVPFNDILKFKKSIAKLRGHLKGKEKNNLVQFPLFCTKCLFLKLIFYSSLTSICFPAQEILSSENLLLWFNSTILLIQYRFLILEKINIHIN